MDADTAARRLYQDLIDGWNAGDAQAIASPLAPDGLVIGFDGSQMVGRDAVATELGRIFADHQTARYVTKVRSVRALANDAVLLYAVTGMLHPDGGEIMSDKNAVQTVVAQRIDGGWAVALFQTTPAQLHGRPELQEAFTAELAEVAEQVQP